MLKKILIALIPILILVAIFYYFFFRSTSTKPVGETPTNQPVAFNPINRGGVSSPAQTPAISSNPTPSDMTDTKPSILRHITLTPIGGFMASSTASSSLVRYIDRGVGHIYEANSTSTLIRKISNTTIPKIYESYWNRNLTVAILRYVKEGTDSVVNFYAEIRPVKVSTSTPVTSDFIPNEIKGKFLSPDIKEIAVSPKKDRIFTFNLEGGRGIGYISGFDESKKTKVIDVPFTQALVEWPEENIITITTKPSAVSAGFFYVFDIKKNALTKLMGGVVGLTAKLSADGKKVIFSTSKPSGVTTNLYTIKDSSTQEVVFKTLPEKCAWSKIHPQEIYCAVPTRFDRGVYPNDWYKGNVSFIDQIWHLDTATGEVRLLADLLTLSDSLIDAVDLTLDPKEGYLYFTNKRDLSLWSLDLTI